MNAVNNVAPNIPVIITLDRDITLNKTLSISANKHIKLTSNSKNQFFKLIGPSGSDTITVTNNGILDLDGITVTHLQDAIGTGVSVKPGGNLTLTSGKITGNIANNQPDWYIQYNLSIPQGGGIYLDAGSFTMYGGEISNNTAARGGGVTNYYGNFTLYGGKISANNADSGGGISNLSEYDFGGIYGAWSPSNFTMYGGEISNNIATDGGGIYTESGFILSGGTILNNHATNGGGIYLTNACLMLDGLISGNTAIKDGGGIYASLNFIIYGGEISNNCANRGGGIYTEDHHSTLLIDNGIISNNRAINGGGIYSAYSRLEISNSTISGNTAVNGGGIYDDSGSFRLSDSIISNNNADANGGGICIYGGRFLDSFYDDGTIYYYTFGYLTLTNSIISNNRAVDGGGIYDKTAGIQLSHSTITNNTASNIGGGIWIEIERLDLLYISEGVMFIDNHASETYKILPASADVYRTHIGTDVVWTHPFTEGYNNYDIGYTGESLFTPYIVRLGDSLWLIANNYKTTINEIKTANRLLSDIIYPGQQLLIPKPQNTYIAQSGDILDAIAVTYNTTTYALKVLNNIEDNKIINAYKALFGEIYLQSGQELQLRYTVQRNDSLWLIAKTYGTTIDALKTLNNLTNDTIYPGQQFLISTPPNIYSVQVDDTIDSIATKCNTTIHTLNVINIYYNYLQVGHLIQLRYVVQPGDSLWLIAKTYGTTIDALKTLNGLTNDMIYVGQLLAIPEPQTTQ